MNTLITGHNDSVSALLKTGLARRNHYIFTAAPGPEAYDLLDDRNISLIFLTDLEETTLSFCRQIRAGEHGRRFAIYAIIAKEKMNQMSRLLDTDIDHYIIESVYDEARLDIRLAFAEKHARNKQGQFLIEQKLRESEANARSILRTTVDAIITIDVRGTIRTFNRAAEKLFQFSAAEVIGKNIHILMPDPYHREHDEYIDNYHKSGNRKIIGIGREVTGQRKDKSTFPMYLAVSEVNVNDQRFYTGIVRDITEQRRLEQEVLRVSEHERHRIGQDLHDGLGQMLTGITLINRSIASSLKEENHPLADEADEITQLIREADQYARNLSRTLIPVELDSSGLVTALHRLAENAERLFNIRCRLDNVINIRFDDPTAMTHLYRIVQEATSNAVKHGHASEVVIDMEKKKGKIVVRIEDNGTGFSDEWEKEKGLGVRIMQYRSNLIGANLQIGKSRSGGASIIITMLEVDAVFHM
ncbi:MAG: PAS domain S-box protein [Balneolaceae bacterium]|nr:MAG: PAS domain S-box protein [Balneolaceae bacterium]